MADRYLEDSILAHIHVIAHSKRAMLQVALEISDEYPSQAAILVTAISALTRSADKLLGDTNVF